MWTEVHNVYLDLDLDVDPDLDLDIDVDGRSRFRCGLIVRRRTLGANKLETYARVQKCS